MPEQFNIEDNNFQKQEGGPIEIDGYLSAEEKQELKESFECDCGELTDETQGRLQDFLQQDVIPNIEQSGLTDIQQESLQLLVGESKEKQVEPSTLSEEVLAEYGLDKNQMDGVENDLSAFGIEGGFENLLHNYEDYITSNLDGLDSSIITKIKQSIGIRAMNLDKSIDGMNSYAVDKGKQDTKSDLRWMMNSSIKDHFSEINDKILPSALLLHEYSTAPDKDIFAQKATQGLDHKYSDSMPEENIARHQMKSFVFQIEQIQEMFAADLDTDGQFDEFGPEFLNQNSVLNISKTENNKKIFTNIEGDQSKLGDISVLNEVDKKREAEAMVCYLLSVGVQCLPYVGFIPSLAVDATDLFSSQDATMTGLKEMGLVHPDYVMAKTGLDNLLAGVGIVLSGVGLQAAAKSGKIAKALKGIQGISLSMISDIISRFSSKMGLGEEGADALKKVVGLEEKEFTKGKTAASDEVLKANGALTAQESRIIKVPNDSTNAKENLLDDGSIHKAGNDDMLGMHERMEDGLQTMRKNASSTHQQEIADKLEDDKLFEQQQKDNIQIIDEYVSGEVTNYNEALKSLQTLSSHKVEQVNTGSMSVVEYIKGDQELLTSGLKGCIGTFAFSKKGKALCHMVSGKSEYNYGYNSLGTHTTDNVPELERGLQHDSIPQAVDKFISNIGTIKDDSTDVVIIANYWDETNIIQLKRIKQALLNRGIRSVTIKQVENNITAVYHTPSDPYNITVIDHTDYKPDRKKELISISSQEDIFGVEMNVYSRTREPSYRDVALHELGYNADVGEDY